VEFATFTDIIKSLKSILVFHSAKATPPNIILLKIIAYKNGWN